MTPIERDFLASGLYGMAVAEALRVPYESCTLGQMTASPCTDMVGYRHHKQAAGHWSHGTSMALCIADSLCNGFDSNDIMKKFVQWKNQWKYMASGAMPEIDSQTESSLNNYEQGVPPKYCGYYGNGNGGLARCFPIAFYQCVKSPVDDDHLELFLDPILVASSLTHTHEISHICCGLYSLFLRERMLFSNPQDSVQSVIGRAYKKAQPAYSTQYLREHAHSHGFESLISDSSLFPQPQILKMRMPEELPSGEDVLNTWNIALWSLLNTDNYKDCVLKAIQLGGDASNAAVAGALAGAFYGIESIPSEWIDQLQNKQLLNDICDKLNAALFSQSDASATIGLFEKQYAFLALSAPTHIEIDGIGYSNTAAAFYALGVDDDDRYEFAGLDMNQAKKRYEEHSFHSSRPEMSRLYEAVAERFGQNEEEAEMLMKTGNLEIIYDTTPSHDNILGRCCCSHCKGKMYDNLYGRLLMEVREDLIRAYRGDPVY